MSSTLPDPESLLLYDGFVRAIARSLVRGEDAVDDVVQQTWLMALRRPLGLLGSPRAWLAKVVRNVVIDKRRTDAHRAERERLVTAETAEAPSAADILGQEEWRRRIVDAVLELAEPYRTTVLLRYFENLPPRSIAVRLGVPVETVRTRTRRALEQLRGDLAQRHGGEDNVLAALVPLAQLGPATATATDGGAILRRLGCRTTRLRLAALALLVATAALTWSMLGASDGASLAVTSSAVDASGLAGGGRALDTASAEPDSRNTQSLRVAVPSGADGSVSVRVSLPDGTPAANVGCALLMLREPATRLRPLSAKTDNAGSATFAKLQAGEWLLDVDRAPPVELLLESGQRLEKVIRLPPAPDARGVVVDARGRPVAGAEIVLEQFDRLCQAHPATKSGADGRFVIRCPAGLVLVTARAPAFAPSLSFECSGNGTLRTVDVRLELRDDPATIEGRVLGPDGEPLEGAAVCFASRKRSLGGDWDNEVRDATYPPPVTTTSGKDGSFRFTECWAGHSQVIACAPGLPVVRVPVSLVAGSTQRIEVRVTRGSWIEGTVRADRGCVAGAKIAAYPPKLPRTPDLPQNRIDFDSMAGALSVRAVTDSEGRFVLGPLSQGEITVKCENSTEELSTTLLLGPNVRARLDLAFGSVTVPGRVVDESDMPVAGIWILGTAESCDDPSMRIAVHADAEGRFVLTGCKIGGRYELGLSGGHSGGREYLVLGPPFFSGVSGARGSFDGSPLLLRIGREQVPSARITGRLSDPSGRPLLNAQFRPHYDLPALYGPVFMPLEEGRFDTGPLPQGRVRLEIRSFDKCLAGLLLEHELAAGEVWDAGDLRMTEGRAITFRVDFGRLPRFPPPTLELRGSGYPIELQRPQGDTCTFELVAAGDYDLLVSDREDLHCAAGRVHIGTESDGERVIRLSGGSKTRIELRNVAGGAKKPVRGSCSIRDSQGQQIWTGMLWLGGNPKEAGTGSTTVSLAPGTYHIEGESGNLHGSAELMVPSADGSPPRVIVDLRDR